MSDIDEPTTPTPSTGDPRVDEVLGRLAGLDEVPVAEHVQVFESVLTGLRSSLRSSLGSSLAEAGQTTHTPA